MKQIKKIQEAVGVPSGIVKTAQNIYNDYLIQFEEDPTKTFSSKVKLDNSDGRYDFAGFKITSIELHISSQQVRGITSDQGIEVECGIGGAAINKQSKFSKGKLQVVSIDEIEITFQIAYVGKPSPEKILNLFKEKKSVLIRTLAHELKHAFDDFKNPETDASDLATYMTVSETRFGNRLVDMFLFQLYFMTQTESLVRPTEVYADAVESGVSKSEFYNFLQKNDVYKTLKNISQFTYEQLRQQLIQDIDYIVEILEHVDVELPKSDDEKVDKFLEVLYVTLTNKSLEKARDFVTPRHPLAFIMTMLGEDKEPEEIFDQMVKKINVYEDKPLQFYKDVIRKNQILAQKLIRKIAKVYSLLEKKSIQTSMKHLETFNAFNEGLFDFFKNPISYREDMKTSKRMKENDIQQEFEKDSDSKKENKAITWLVWGKEKKKVAKIQISGVDEYGRPLIDLYVFGEDETPIIRKRFLEQENAIHHFLDYWESHTKEGQAKNQSLKLKKF